MSNLRQLPKPNADITNYEWSVTPLSVKLIINHLQELLEDRKEVLENLQVENKWLRQQLDLELDKPRGYTPSVPEVILWAMIGLILTTGGTFVPAYALNTPWHWGEQGLQLHNLGVSCQIGAVLLTGCLGGKNAALLSQLAYLIIGLTWLPIFDQGGSWQYIQEPTFGYLLGFVIGAWLCGWFAFKTKAQLNSLAFSCLLGLIAVHLVGIIYLAVLNFWIGVADASALLQDIVTYSIHPLPGQLAVICAVSLIAFVMRKLMFA